MNHGIVDAPPAGGNPPAWPTHARSPGDIRRPYLEACDRWAEADRRHHIASMAVASGTGTTEELALARVAEMDALGAVEAAKYDMAEVLFAMLRVVANDSHLKYALLLRLLDLFRPALEPLADRIEDLELLVTDRRGVA